jgi:hypothetical protein
VTSSIGRDVSSWWSAVNEARPVEQDVGKAIDQVSPLFLRLLRRVFVGDFPSPLRKPENA